MPGFIPVRPPIHWIQVDVQSLAPPERSAEDAVLTGGREIHISDQNWHIFETASMLS